jgi:hypothetical protein
MGPQHPVEHGDRLIRIAVVIGPRHPGPGVVGGAERLGADDRRAAGRHGGGGGLGRRRARTPAAEQPPLGRAERAEHDDVGGLPGVSPDDVAAVGRAERPGELDLDEAEERPRGQRSA